MARITRLFDYQEVGVAWLRQRIASGRSSILTDEPGLGKTAQAISAIDGRMVVVCPSIMKPVWANEVAELRPARRVIVVNGTSPVSITPEYDTVIINYDILHSHERSLSQFSCGGATIVADECHMLKSDAARRTQVFRRLAKRSVVVGLSGTPMLNNPADLWGSLRSIGIREFGLHSDFIAMFDGRKNIFGAWEWGANRDINRIKYALRLCMLRRKKSDVWDQMPMKIHTDIHVPLARELLKNSRLVDDGMVDGVVDHDMVSSRIVDGLPIDVAEYAHLRMESASAKIGFAKNVVDEFEENQTPLIVWSAHTAPVREIGTRSGWAYIDGSVPNSRREQVIYDFQNGKLNGVACNIKSAGSGITLTIASNALFVDWEWTPALNLQAEDRIHRIGQMAACNYIHLVGDTKLERAVHSALQKKQQMISDIIG